MIAGGTSQNGLFANEVSVLFAIPFVIIRYLSIVVNNQFLFIQQNHDRQYLFSRKTRPCPSCGLLGGRFSWFQNIFNCLFSCSILRQAMSKYFSSISIPIDGKPHFIADTIAVPLPINGSRTVAFVPDISRSHFVSLNGFSAGCPVGLFDDHLERFISGMPRSSIEKLSEANRATSS